MKMQEWEATKSNSWIDGIVQSLASTLPADQGSIFSDFSTKGYAGAVDLKLISGHGQEILYSDFTDLFLNTTKADMMVKSYLIEKGAYIDKCMQYIEAEYNPVENYAGHEEETITFNGGARHKETEYNKGQQQDTNLYGQQQNTLVKGATQLTDEYGATSDTHIKGATQLTDQYGSTQDTHLKGATQLTDQYDAVSDTHVKGATQLTDQYGPAVTTTVNGQNGYDETHHIAKTSTQKNPSSLTRTEKSAPFDSDTFYNEKQYYETYGTGTETVERVAVGGDGGDDKISYSQKTDQITAEQHSDTHSTLEATDTDTRAARSDIHSTTSVTDTDSSLAHTDTHSTISVTDTDSSLVHTDTHSTIQVTDTSTDATHTDTLTAGTRKDTGSEDSDGYEDTTERVLDRAGNLGVMTAAEMMQKDYTFWKSFRWLSDMALDIVKLTCEGVICI